MKKFILLAILAIASLSAAAGTGDAVFNKAIAAYKAAKGIAVKYSMTGAVGNSSGEIIMQGNKFCITASNMICWYNGKTQWSYSTMSNEVSIMEPTASELQVVNPFSVISNFQTAYTATLMKGNASSNIVQLKPKNARTSQFSQVVVTIAKKDQSSIEDCSHNARQIENIHHPKRLPDRGQLPGVHFRLQQKICPGSTQVVDLR